MFFFTIDAGRVFVLLRLFLTLGDERAPFLVYGQLIGPTKMTKSGSNAVKDFGAGEVSAFRSTAAEV